MIKHLIETKDKGLILAHSWKGYMFITVGKACQWGQLSFYSLVQESEDTYISVVQEPGNRGQWADVLLAFSFFSFLVVLEPQHNEW